MIVSPSHLAPPEMLKSMFSSSIARLNLFAFDDVVSRCSREPTSCTSCELASPKISLNHDHNWTKGNDQSGSTVEHQPVGKLVQQSLGEALHAGSSKPTQSKPNPFGDRTGKLVEQENTSCSREIVGKRCKENLVLQIERGKPVKCEDNRVMNVHDRTGKLVEGRGDKYRLSYNISPVFNLATFKMQWAGSVP